MSIHERINLELIFEKPYEIVALIEDITGELEPFEDFDRGAVCAPAQPLP